MSRFITLVLLLSGFSLAREDYALWNFRQYVSLNTTASGADIPGDAAGFPILIRLDSSNFNFSQALPGGEDIRFSGSSGRHLPYEIERWDPAARRAEIWVRADTVFGNSSAQFFVMYWGNASAADSSRGAAVFDTANGFEGVWHLNDTGPFADATAGQNPGADHADAAGKDGMIGLGQEFNGTNDYIEVPRKAAYDAGTGPFSISFWFKKNGADRGDAFGWKTGGDFGVLLQDSGYARVYWDGWAVYNGSPWTIGPWHFFALVRGPGAKLTTYIDGRPDGSGTSNKDINSLTGSLIIGSNGTAGSYSLDGNMDEFRFSTAGRPADWIKLCYENQRSGQVLTSFSGANRLPRLGFSQDGILPASAVSQSADGEGVITLSFKAQDQESDAVTLLSFHYSLDGGVSWIILDPASGALPAGWADSVYASAPVWHEASAHLLTWDTRHEDVAGLDGVENSLVRVRISGTDNSISGVSATTNVFTVDNRSPVFTIDSVTSPDLRPQISLTADEPLRNARITVNGKAYDAAAINGQETRWAAAVGTAESLAAGVYDVSAEVEDLFGNRSTGSARGALTVNRNVPAVTVDSLVTSERSPGISGTVSDNTLSGVLVTIGAETERAYLAGDGTWRIIPNTFSPLEPGVYDVKASAANEFGEGTDNTADELTIVDVDLSVHMDDLITNEARPGCSGLVSYSSARVTVAIGGKSADATVSGDGTWHAAGSSFDVLEEGRYTVFITADDPLKGKARDTASLVVDLTPPSLEALTPASGTTTGLQPELMLTFSEPVTAGGGTIRIFPAGSVSPIEQITAGSPAVSGLGSPNVSIALGTPLDTASSYYVTVGGSCFRDSAGNFFQGIRDSSQWTFISRALDDAYIDSIAGVTASGYYGLGDTIVFRIYFSEPVILSNGRLSLPLMTGGPDTSLEVTGLFNASLIELAYPVRPGDNTPALKTAGQLVLSPGARLRNSGGSSVVLSIDAGRNLQDHRTYRLDGIIPQVTNVVPGSGSAVLAARAAYTLSEKAVSGRLSWGEGILGDTLLGFQDGADTVLAGILLEPGRHEIWLDPALLTLGARYTVVLEFRDSVGNTALIRREAVKLVSGISGIRTFPGDTSVILGDLVQFRAMGLDNSAGFPELVALDGIKWRAWGDGSINTGGLYLAARLGTGFAAARFGSFEDTVKVICSSGSVGIKPLGDDTVFLGSNIEIIVPSQKASLGDGILHAVLMPEQATSPSFSKTGPALTLSNSTGQPMVLSRPALVRLKMDLTVFQSEDAGRVQVYRPGTGGGLWEWIDAELQEQWLVFEADTLGSYFTGIDTVPPLLGWLSRPAEGLSGDPVTIRLSAFDNIANPRVILRTVGGGSEGADAMQLVYDRGGAVTGQIPGSRMGESGLYYTVEITDGSNSEFLGPVDLRINLRYGLNVPDTVPPPENQYGLISFPLESDESYLDSMVFDDWGPADSRNWRIFSYRESFTEMEGRSRIRPGAAYWFRYNGIVPSYTLKRGKVWTLPVSRPFSIALDPEWNCIANPFLFPVSSARLTMDGGVPVPHLFAYEEGVWQMGDEVPQLDPWKGYVVWNGAAGSRISDSLFINPLPASAPAARTAAVSRGTRIHLQAESRGIADGELVMAFGVPGALAGQDRYDYPKPQFHEKPVSISLVPNWADAGSFLSDFRGEPGEGQSWSIRLSGAGPEMVKLGFRWPEAWPEDLKAVLLDTVRGRVTRLPASEISLHMQSSGSQGFALLVGTPDFIEDKISDFRQKTNLFSLSQNWPNPFSTATYIRYSLPAGSGSLPVQLEVRDLSGKIAVQLISRQMPPGQYGITWDGTGAFGNSLPAGTYFLRLRAGKNLESVRKMVILR